MERDALHCDINKTGVCALHNVEIERRKGESAAIGKSIIALETSVLGLDSIVKSLSRSFYGFIGTTVLISMIIAGSFIYTKEVGGRAEERDALLISSQAVLTKQVSDIAISTARNEGMQSALIGELREFTKAIRKRDFDKASEGD